MSLVINTNFAATVASNNLAASNQLLQRSLNRLSSGSKIVNPADDAGGLAVSMKLAAAAKRQAAVMSNLSNGVSYLQTQDGALKVAAKVLDRISELKTLAADPTKNASDIANYDAEFDELRSQLSSLSSETFNGVALFGSSTLNVPTTEDGNSSVEIGGIELMGSGSAFDTSLNDLSGWTDDSTGGGDADANGGILTLDDDVSGEAAVTTNQTFSGPMTLEYVQTGGIEVSFGGDDIVNIVGPGTILLEFDGAGNVDLSIDGSYLASYTVPTSGAISFGTGSGNGTGTVSNLNITGGGGGGSGNISDVAGESSLTDLDLSTVTGAIQDLATFRATNGAQQSRLGFASELLTTNKANLEAATSRITDVDVAQESTQLARYNILVQAGTSMLAQANQSTQSVLKLIG